MPPLETSCADHEARGWCAVTDWMGPMPEDRKLVQQKYARSAMQYAKEKAITPRKCGD